MIQSISQLTELLREEQLLYESLTDSIRREQLLIQSFDAKSLTATISQKETLQLRIKALEQRRAEIVMALGREIGCAPRSINISKLLPHLEPQEQEELLGQKDRLLAAISEMREAAEQLDWKYRATIGIFEDTMRFIVSDLAEHKPEQAYSRKGMMQGTRRAAESVIVSTQV